MYSSNNLVLITILVAAARACSDVSSVEHTFYGYPDNSPPGPATAYNCGGRNYVAGGTGTYSNPLTFATASGEFKVCEILYVPYLQKYVRMEDECDECTSDWNNGIGSYHIDIWTGSSTVNGGQDQINCEDNLTPSAKHTIIRSPANNLPVDATVLYSKEVTRAARPVTSTTPLKSATTAEWQ